MAEKKDDLMEWLGFANPPKFVNAPRFGRILGWFLMVFAILIFLLACGIIAKFTVSVFSGGLRTEIDQARTTRELGTAVLALFGAPFLVWRTVIASKQAHTAEQGLYTDRIAKAVEQIGADKVVKQQRKDEKGNLTYERDKDNKRIFSKPIMVEETAPNLEVRIGGLYALERIARDSPKDHITVMEIICAYIRENCKPDVSQFPADDAPLDVWINWDVPAQQHPRSDINTAISVINNRDKRQLEREKIRKFKLNLAGVDFRGLTVKLTNFSGTNFNNAKFLAATISNSTLRGAHFDTVDFRKARLWSSDFSNSTFFVCDLKFAVFNDAKLVTTVFDGCRFQSASFTDAYLMGAKIGYSSS
ncbi:pentapeptide repeat-containing protein [Halocynthiibacter namhaensis]|uniref:pentapeptide repeat-containing protein n=1 Tax=Halocynthiibacter namhaensis TaxID=1290553 RepID=UPI00068DDB58|nr:pentapeptide repeat-containing protein [Halocynthiibacter namhaensis]